MPRLSDSMEEGTILKWLVAEGDDIQPAQPLVEVETDKAVVTHEAAAAGRVLSLTVSEGSTVPVGAPIAVLGEPGESLPHRSSSEALAAAGAGAAETGQAGATQDGAPPKDGAAKTPQDPPVRVKASPLARRIAAER